MLSVFNSVLNLLPLNWAPFFVGRGGDVLHNRSFGFLVFVNIASSGRGRHYLKDLRHKFCHC